MAAHKHYETQLFEIQKLSKKGRGLSTDSSCEVIGALPGEEVLASLGPKKKRTRVAFLKEILRSSPHRVDPLCSHVPDCGGCSLQQMDYQVQLKQKEEWIYELFSQWDGKIGSILGYKASKTPWAYRNKMEFSFSEDRSGRRYLGLILAGTRGKVFNLQKCHLVSDWFSEAVSATRKWWKKTGIRAYHHRSDEGSLRTLTLRESIQGKGKMAILTVSGNPQFALKQSQIGLFVETLKETAEEGELSLFVQVHQIAKGRPTQFFEMLVLGPDHITERLHVKVGDKSRILECKISPTSFFQPNTLQAERLYSVALSLGSHLKGGLVYDLYCGSGTIGLSAALIAKKVIGIELNPHSVFDANWNKEVNEINNFFIHCGDVGKVLVELQEDEKPDCILLDPPRVGVDQRVLSHLIRFSPKEIIYISCNPASQAANIATLVEGGYVLERVQPIDQFPHTPHIENICFLQKT